MFTLRKSLSHFGFGRTGLILRKNHQKLYSSSASISENINDTELNSRHSSNFKAESKYGKSSSKDLNENVRNEQAQSDDITNRFFDKIVIIDSIPMAENVLAQLNELDTNIFWGCDTEVTDIDLKVVGPVGNGKVTCVSMYGGPDVDFGYGKDKIIWIDNLPKDYEQHLHANGRNGVLDVFKSWFNDPNRLKVWHNYGFDRHVMYNEQIDCLGFGGDTMHMARLWNTNRDKAQGGVNGYSLESLSEDLVKDEVEISKISMMDLFGIPRKLKNGDESKLRDIPDIKVVQTDSNTRDKWIEYSAKDAYVTWYLHKKLKSELESIPWIVERNEHDEVSPLDHSEQVTHPSVHSDSFNDYNPTSNPSFTPHPASYSQQSSQANAAIRGDVSMSSSRRVYTPRPAQLPDHNHPMLSTSLHSKPLSLQSNQQLAKPSSLPHPVLNPNEMSVGNMYEFYMRYLREFGEVLTDMERIGIKVDTTGHLRAAEELARKDRQEMNDRFIRWLESQPHQKEVAKYINTASSAQIQHLLFGEYVNKVRSENETRVFKVEKSDEEIEEERKRLLALNPYAELTSSELKLKLKERQLKVSGKKPDLMRRLIEYDDARKIVIESLLQSHNIDKTLDEDYIHRQVNDMLTARAGFDKASNSTNSNFQGNDTMVDNDKDDFMFSPGKIKKTRDLEIKTLGLTPISFTPLGAAQVSTANLLKLAGRNVFDDDENHILWGAAKTYFGGQEYGKEACRAIGALARIGQIDSTITNFLVPLQALVDKESRIHCSLNLNTETGRLSSRRPNLQNQPALEKDQYKIRDAFVAEKGNTLIVADYGQLELRILAHITRCKSMIEAFNSGGCFHSRTAVGMYDHIKEAIARGEVLLEWDYSKGEKPPRPLVKEVYASERRKAKTLNFSIAYGKTVHGLAADWGISIDEATKTLEAWYRDRPEVKEWQEMTRERASKEGHVRTIMGRYRQLPAALNKYEPRAHSHALRAAINTPIQGSAADVVMMAMIKIQRSQKLKDLNWKLLLQIHDEVILEGPVESKDEALNEVRQCMEDPFDHFGLKPMLVHLDVDAKSADTWYRAK